MANRDEILRMTLRQPTARLSESEAHERAERLREAGRLRGSKAQGNTPNFREFRRDWQRMMVRED